MREFIEHEICNNKKIRYCRILKSVILDTNIRFIFLLRLLFWSKKRTRKLLNVWANNYLRLKYGCYIGSSSDIGLGIKFPHPNGIIIGEHTTIGKNCIIYQQVTFGGRNIGDANQAKYPKICDNVIIFSGAKLIGDITVGQNAIIGANSLVNKNVPSYTVVGGVPAKIIRHLQSE